jgi:hypothetical protein
MARSIGWPGHVAAQNAVFDGSEPLVTGFIVILVVAAFSGWIRGAAGWTVMGATLVIEGAFFHKSLGELIRRGLGSRHWWRGARGEKRTAEELAKLPDDYVVFHDFAFRRNEHEWHDWNLDHIVIGPTGVFVLETKNTSPARILPVSVDWRTRKAVKQVRRNACDLRDRLVAWSRDDLHDVWVEGWVVYAQDGVSVEKLQEGSTHVLPLRLLVNDIQRRPKRDVDWDQAFRITQALCTHLPEWQKVKFASAIRQAGADHAARMAASRAEDVRRPARQPESPAQLSRLVPEVPSACPLCGAPLVRHVAGRGERRGKAFLGCSKWREKGCVFIHNLEEPAA